MKLAELVDKVDSLTGEVLGCPDTINDNYVSNEDWQESEVPDSCKAVWVTQGPMARTGCTFWFEAEIKDGKLEGLTRWYSDDATEPRQVETIFKLEHKDRDILVGSIEDFVYQTGRYPDANDDFDEVR